MPSETGLQTLLDEIQAAGGIAVAQPAAVNDFAQVKAGAQRAVQEFALEGYGVSWASAGREAIHQPMDGASAQSSASTLPEPTLLDLQLPDMS